MNRSLAILMVGFLAVAGCQPERPELLVTSVNGERRSLKDALSEINLKDGVDQKEARLLADVYFEFHYGSCGGAHFTEGDAQGWRFNTVVGYGAVPGGVITVNKVTGHITCTDGPEVKDVQKVASFEKIGPH